MDNSQHAPGPNQPGHLDSRTGRLCVTAIDAFNREDPDSPLYLFMPESVAGEWVPLEGIDPENRSDPATVDIWTTAGRCLANQPATSPVYLGKRESADRIAKATGSAS